MILEPSCPILVRDVLKIMGRVVLVRDFIGPSGLVRVVFGPSCHPQHLVFDGFDCCTERYEIVVLLPNSEDTCYWKYFLEFE